MCPCVSILHLRADRRGNPCPWKVCNPFQPRCACSGALGLLSSSTQGASLCALGTVPNVFPTHPPKNYYRLLMGCRSSFTRNTIPGATSHTLAYILAFQPARHVPPSSRCRRASASPPLPGHAPARQPPSPNPFPRNSNAYHPRSVDTQPSQWRGIAVCWAAGFGGQDVAPSLAPSARGVNPAFGRRALGYPPPRARGFCPAVRAPFVQLARSLSLICVPCRMYSPPTHPKLLSAADGLRVIVLFEKRPT